MGDLPARPDADLPRLGRIAGVLFIACSIASLPSGQFLEPQPPASANLALFAPLLLDPTDSRSEARHALVTLPVLLIGTIAVYWQRIRLEERERSQRAFAAEAIELALRIRRGAHPPRPTGAPVPAEELRLTELAREASGAEAARSETASRP